MELGIPNAPAGGLATNTNTGYATILDQSSFDPVTFMQNYNAQRKADEIAKAKEGMARAAKWKDYKLPEIKDIYWTNQQEIDEAINKMSDVAADYAANNGDPDSPEFKKALVPFEQTLIQAQNEGKDLYNFVSGLYEKAAADPSKYDPEELSKWVEGLKSQPTIKDKLKYRENTPIFTPKFNIYETLGKIVPAESVQERLLGNGQSVVTTGYDRPTMKNFIEENVAALKLTNPAEMQKTFEDGVTSGQWKTPDEMIESLTNTAMTWGQESKRIEGTKNGGLSINLNGGTVGDGVNFNYIYDQEYTPASKVLNDTEQSRLDYLQKKYDDALKNKDAYIAMGEEGKSKFLSKEENEDFMALKAKAQSEGGQKPEGLKGIVLSRKGAPIAPNVFQNDKGQETTVAPTKLVKVKDNSGKEFWRIEGKVGSAKSIISKEEYENNKTKYGRDDVEVKLLPDGKYEVIVYEAKNVSLPLSDANKTALATYMGVSKSEIDKIIAGGETQAPATKPTLGKGGLDDLK